ncbi:putative bifunctional diguanylate cyclase/phosphodiesterase [Sphaerotilus microaerophilus]|uniref:Two-component system response regulator n=1 Tax=Sphaerotilus microaerophilus TaxID=2914710 RepID=A0ABN6PN00_9BURK|nr:EAL domain-containing protein [Sphaerotilus sp. FB-5]BDI05948.1 two-component system response regulator [Sphaerotilus sp. FB-5]
MGAKFSAPTGRRPQLLLVDDDALLRSMALRTLRHAGFDVTEADSGEAALASFAASPSELVLLDVMMEGIDGFETCRRLRQLPAGAEVPVLMLTGLDDTGSIEQAYQAGATDFITKPIHWGLLSHRIRYALRSAEARVVQERSRVSLLRAQRLAHMGNWEFDGEGHMACSEELAHIFGAPEDAMQCASPEDFLARVASADRERVARARSAAAFEGIPYQLTFTIERFDGARRTVSEHAAPLRDALGRLVGVEGITQDITERIEAERQVRQLALYDGLTGLPNRQFFLEMVDSALQRHGAGRANAGLCAVLHLDLVQFRSINDALGRDGGDRVLRVVAERLQAGTRSRDLMALNQSAPPNAVVARIAANGFMLMLGDLGQHAHAGQAAERLIRAVERPILFDGRDVVLTAAIGIAVHPRDGSGAAELAAHAEQALYAAKRAGRSQYRYFDEGLNAVARERLERESELRHGIEQGQLRLHFQPKVDATTRRVVGVEALVRWQHPRLGLVMPGDFIALAEETGLIQPLTDWVLEAACEALAHWPPEVAVSVNIAAPSFAGADLGERLDALVARHGLQPGRLVLEVTESMLMSDTTAGIARLHELREHGYLLSLDDFGTGYSSLSHVKRFPLHELKIDRAFVRDLYSDGKDRALVASIITLARLLDLQVVAEGVETEQQAAILCELGCTVHQGYLYARPLPEPALLALLGAALPPAATRPGPPPVPPT